MIKHDFCAEEPTIIEEGFLPNLEKQNHSIEMERSINTPWPYILNRESTIWSQVERN
jgi:hypothetical protein